MEKPEIVAGIKNAVERGSSLEKAKQSFINAGYNKADVEDSAKSLSGVISRIPEQPRPIEPSSKTAPAPTPTPAPSPEISVSKEEKGLRSKKLVIILIIVLLVLIAGLIAAYFLL